MKTRMLALGAMVVVLMLCVRMPTLTAVCSTVPAPKNLRIVALVFDWFMPAVSAQASCIDASNTGVRPGTTLTNCNPNITANNVSFTNCLFNGAIQLNGHTGLQITNSRIVGVILGNGSGGHAVGTVVQMTDVEINGGNSDFDATQGLNGYTCTRCNVHDAAKGFTGTDFTVVDSYVHDLFGNGATASHNEPALVSQGNVTIRHSHLISRFSSASTGGGMSANIAIYTHGSFWPNVNNVTLDDNYLEGGAPESYCLYGGNSADKDPSNIHVTNNVFVTGCGYYGYVVGWLRGNGNTWTGNTFSNGSTFAEPPTGNYN